VAFAFLCLFYRHVFNDLYLLLPDLGKIAEREGFGSRDAMFLVMQRIN